MIKLRGSLLDRIFHRLSLRRWRRKTIEAQSMSSLELRSQRKNALHLKDQINNLIEIADSKLTLPMLGSNMFHKPHGTDWSWRPGLWRAPLETPGLSSAKSKSRLSKDVRVFHDCKQSELTLRQIRNLREADFAPFGLKMDVLDFNGSFLSLLIDLPPEATEGLQRRHIISMGTIIELEKPMEVYARLNIRHGPNVEQLVRQVQQDKDGTAVEFDLGHINVNENRIEHAWIDMTFETPQMSQIIMRDLTFNRFPRAEM